MSEGRRPRGPEGHLVSWSALAIIVLLVGIGILPVPYVKVSPGPVHDVLGEADGVAVIQISDTVVFPTNGELDMLTVTERGGPAGPLSLPEAYWGWLGPDQQVVPRDALFPPGQSSEEAEQIGARQFSQAESDAIGAALAELGTPAKPEAIVVSVLANGPSASSLEPGDVIVRVGKIAVSTPGAVAAAVRSRPVGAQITFGIIRGSAPLEVTVTLAADPDNPNQARAGIVVGANYKPPFPVTISLEGVGGPSAGLVFSLGLVDKLSPDSLTGGRVVAATGTIGPDGRVGAIGGVREKVAAARGHGAEILLVPLENCRDLAGLDFGSMRVGAVAMLHEAVVALRGSASGDAGLPSCP